MSVDLVCGEAAFVDITWVGLDALPGPGEERHAIDLVRAPGGSATVAVAAARLGLSVALCCPLGVDPEGELIREALKAEGVLAAGRPVARTPVTGVLPVGGDRAMVTFDPGESVTADDLAAVRPRAAVLGAGHVSLAPAGTRVYVSLGDREARAGVATRDLRGAHALLVNAREGELITGRADPVEAARALGELVPCAVVTRGAAGAVACEDGRTIEAPGVAARAVDTTGAGDLFCAAYIWADTLGLAATERLAWAVLYAALSIGVPTGLAGAVTEDELVAAGEQRHLTPPATTMSTMRRRSSCQAQ